MPRGRVWPVVVAEERRSDVTERAVGRGAGVVGRRDVLRWGLLALGATCVPGVARAARPASRAIALYSMHTGEALEATYWADGRYDPEALDAVAWLLRDHRTDETHPIDPGVLDVLCTLQDRLGASQPFHVVSGYRSPETNRLRCLESRAVAKDSLHMYGQAVDVFLPRRDLRTLRRAAVALGAGGVGYYPRSGFVHLDTGRPRTW